MFWLLATSKHNTSGWSDGRRGFALIELALLGQKPGMNIRECYLRPYRYRPTSMRYLYPIYLTMLSPALGISPPLSACKLVKTPVCATQLMDWGVFVRLLYPMPAYWNIFFFYRNNIARRQHAWLIWVYNNVPRSKLEFSSCHACIENIRKELNWSGCKCGKVTGTTHCDILRSTSLSSMGYKYSSLP